jgi:radical SAM protein with 4Fe4S-binding SPASM domain
LLKKDIYELFKYAKDRNLEVRLDISNIFVKDIKSLAERIVDLVDYVITYVDYRDIKNSEKKREILSLKKAGIKIVRAVTLANSENTRNIEKIYRFLLECKVDKWAINRDVYRQNIKKGKIKGLVGKVVSIKKDIIKNKFFLKVHIVYAIPFCADDPIKVNFICTGAKSIDGYERLLVDAQGIVKPIHYFDKKVGDFRNIAKAWSSPFMKSIRTYKFLPEDCKNCFFLEKCKGGSRFCAYQIFGSYQAPDPLMDYANVKNYIW